MKQKQQPIAYRAKKGVVLMSALIILLTLTMIGLAIIRLSVVELKIAGASQRYQILFNDAEAMVSNYLYSNQRNFVKGCLSHNFSGSLPSAPARDQCRYIQGYGNSSSTLKLSGGNFVLDIPNILTDYSRVNLTIEQMFCINNYFSQIGSGNGVDFTAPSALFLDVQARAWDQLDSDASVTIHTGVVSALPPGKQCEQHGG